MERFGFFRIAAAAPKIKVADCIYNTSEIIKYIKEAEEKGVKAILFPELAITGYTSMELLSTRTLREGTIHSLQELKKATSHSDIAVIVGHPLHIGTKLFNCASVIQSGKILGIAVKRRISNYGEFQEARWFSGADELDCGTVAILGEEVAVGEDLIFSLKGERAEAKFGVMIGNTLAYGVSDGSYSALAGAQIIFNPSSNCEMAARYETITKSIEEQSRQNISAFVYASSGFGESTTDLVHTGNAIIAEKGRLSAASSRFSLEEQLVIQDVDLEYIDSERCRIKSFKPSTNGIICCGKLKERGSEEIDYRVYRNIKRYPFIPAGSESDERYGEIVNIQAFGLARRLIHTNCKSSVIGISGGLDSTLALMVVVKAFDLLKYDRKGIIAITMPGFGTTGRTYNNAIALMESLGVTIMEISIKEACIQHFRDIEHDINNHNVVYENSQARERTQILMDVANKYNSMVIGTGDMSELALGWATYNGDHMSMYGVNGNIPKTLVRKLVEWIAGNEESAVTRETLLDIVNTPISPELTPADEKGNIKQKTEDLVGPYELHDFFLYHFLRYRTSPSKIYHLAKIAFNGIHDDQTIKKWLSTFFRRFFNQQFKRSCLPDGPKVGSIGLSPRGDWQMPSDASSVLWLQEIENLG